jgi:hypothetical protein
MEESMKRALIVLFLVSALTLGFAIGASAMSASTGLIRIPFAFHAGDQLMPAGDYYFEMPMSGRFATGTLVKVYSQTGSICQHLFSQAVDGGFTDNDWHVTFDKYGDTYFLSKVRNSDHGAELSISRSEKRLAAEYRKGAKELGGTVDLRAVPAKAK